MESKCGLVFVAENLFCTEKMVHVQQILPYTAQKPHKGVSNAIVRQLQYLSVSQQKIKDLLDVRNRDGQYDLWVCWEV